MLAISFGNMKHVRSNFSTRYFFPKLLNANPYQKTLPVNLDSSTLAKVRWYSYCNLNRYAAIIGKRNYEFMIDMLIKVLDFHENPTKKK